MRWDGRHAGLLGAGGVLSFFPTKTLGTIGDAGMILTDDPEVAQLADVLRHHGRLGKTIDDYAGISNLAGMVGTNSKMDDLQAAVLMAKLTRLDRDIARRAELAAAYGERLRDAPGVLRVPTVVLVGGLDLDDIPCHGRPCDRPDSPHARHRLARHCAPCCQGNAPRLPRAATRLASPRESTEPAVTRACAFPAPDCLEQRKL